MKNYNYYIKSKGYEKKHIFCKLAKCYKHNSERKYWIRNLFDEHFLPEVKMKEITEIVRLSGDLCFDYSELVKHGYSNLCLGGRCRIDKKKIVVGSYIPKNRFINYLSNDHKTLFKTRDEIEKLILDLCTSPNDINPKYNIIPLRPDNRIIWMMWDNINYTNNPLFFLTSDFANEALTAFGLGYDEYEGEDGLFFTFSVNSEMLNRPTICDSGYNNFFRPTDIEFEDHGIIKPLNDGRYNILDRTLNLSPDAFHIPESVNWGRNYTIKEIIKCNLLRAI